MKKILVFLICTALTLMLLSSCDKIFPNGETPDDEGNSNVGDEGGNTPGGDDNTDDGGNTPGGDDNTDDGGNTPGGDDNTDDGGNTPGGDDNTDDGGNTPGGDDNTDDGGNTPGGDDDNKDDEEDDEEIVASPFVGNDDLTTLCVLSSASAKISAQATNGALSITLTDENAVGALMVRVPIEGNWDTVKITQGNTVSYAKVYKKNGVAVIDFAVLPNAESVILTSALADDDKTLESEFGMTLENGTKIDTNYYPGFVRKSVTFTLDDGIYQYDKKVVDILKPYGFTGTFNINNPASVTDPSIYEGFEVANHNILHAVAEKAQYAALEKIYTERPANADTTKVYLKSQTIDGEKVEGLYYVYIGGSWHAMAADETYIKYLEWTTKELEKIFGEGTVVGFAYPHGNQYNDAIIEYLKSAGYLYGRRTGNLKATTGFALPEDRYTWTYNADHNCLLEVMAAYDAYADDGQLKMFSFGVHAKDFETYGKWDDLKTFAELYGNRQSDFWYATNRQIFEYEDAINALDINEERIVNNSDIEVYVTVNNEKVIIPANSVYYYDGTVKANVTFDADNGTAPTSVELNIGGFATQPEEPKKNGFKFLGWYDKNGKEYDFNERVAANITLTAKYEALPFEDATAEILPVKGGAGGIVSIIHDDGRSPSGLILDRLFLKYDLVGDVALLVSNVYNASSQTTKAEYDKWKAIIDTGRWGIISHSMTHTWWGQVLQDVNGKNSQWIQDDEKMYDEIVLAQEILRNLFPGHRVLTYAYPGFSSEKSGLTAAQYLEIIYGPDARELIDQYYISARNSTETGPAYVTEDSNWLYLDAFFLSPSKINGTGSGSLLNRLESASNDGRIHMISMHAVSDDVAPGTSDYTMSTVDVENAMKMIAEYVDAGKVWNAHYEDAILYVREAQNATVSVSGNVNGLTVLLTDTMDDDIYNYPLTVRITVPGTWEAAKITQGDKVSYATAKYLDGKWLIDTDIVPDGGEAIITPIAKDDIPYIPVETPKPTPSFNTNEINYSQSFEGNLTSVPSINEDDLKAGVVDLGGEVGKVYSIDKTKTTYSSLSFGTNSVKAEQFVFKMKLYVDSESTRGGTIITRLHFSSSTSDTPYLGMICKANGGFCFGELGAVKKDYSTTSVLAYDTWHDIKLEVRVSGNGAYLAQYFVKNAEGNYELIGESENYGNGTVGNIPATINSVFFGLYSTGQPKMYIDDISLVAGKADYVGLPKIGDDDNGDDDNGGNSGNEGGDAGDDNEGGTSNPNGGINAPDTAPTYGTNATVDFENGNEATVGGSGSISYVAHGDGQALKYEEKTSSMGALKIPLFNEQVVEAFSLTFDINVASATEFAATIYLGPNDKTPYMMYLQASNGGYFIGDCQSNSGGAGVKTTYLTGATALSFNTWYTIRIDAVFTSADTFKAVWYVNGVKTGESTNRANYSKTSDRPLQNTVSGLYVSSLSSATIEFQLDNLAMSAGNAKQEDDGSTTLLDLDFNANTTGVNNKKPANVNIDRVEYADRAGDYGLKVEKHQTGTSEVLLAAGQTVTNAKELTLEFDINITEKSSNTTLVQMFLASPIGNSPFDMTWVSTSNGYVFRSLTNASGGTTHNFSEKETVLEYGKFYHIKLHIVLGDKDSFLATLYVDGVEVGTSTAYYEASANAPSTTVNALSLYCQSSAIMTMYLDNIILKVK